MLQRTPWLLPTLYPSLLWRMPQHKKELYLTFDDGPMPGPTDFVLNVLAQRCIKATFFCIGDNVHKHPALFKLVVQAGHTIGNHTFNHVKGWQTRTACYIDNINQCDSEIRVHSSLPIICFFRPPYGRITRKQIKKITDKTIVMWDVLTRDYDAALMPQKCLEQSLAAVRNGSIIVFHDSYKAERNLTYVLPRFIDECMRQGYTFKAL